MKYATVYAISQPQTVFKWSIIRNGELALQILHFWRHFNFVLFFFFSQQLGNRHTSVLNWDYCKCHSKKQIQCSYLFTSHTKKKNITQATANFNFRQAQKAAPSETLDPERVIKTAQGNAYKRNKHKVCYVAQAQPKQRPQRIFGGPKMLLTRSVDPLAYPQYHLIPSHPIPNSNPTRLRNSY